MTCRRHHQFVSLSDRLCMYADRKPVRSIQDKGRFEKSSRKLCERIAPRALFFFTRRVAFWSRRIGMGSSHSRIGGILRRVINRQLEKMLGKGWQVYEEMGI